ncbi:MAG TPA: phosphate ABC transporter permease subunit PstC, partial [Candidatus Saccharicenans sp.]|nr:phosphate ABC transporter permease subunit PstC [Candidatus Saccharicenans sp.]
MRSVKKKGLLGDLRESLIHRLFQVSGMLAILILAGILALLLYTSIPAFKEIGFKEFLTSTRWDPTSPEKPEYGFLSMLASTFMITIGAMLIAFPLGVAVASYLSDVASPRVREIVKPIVELLAAIPSVVVGFIGMN